MKNLHARLLFGTLMIVGLVGLLWLDGWMERRGGPAGVPLAALVVALTVVATIELARMERARGLDPMTTVAAVAAACIGVSPFLRNLGVPLGPLLVAALAVAAIFLLQAASRRTENAVGRIAATLLPVGYLGLFGLFILQVRIDFGLAALLLYLAAVKFTDIGAYFVGSALGRHKMIPWLSPGKSWEGLAGGIVVSVAVSLAIALPLHILGAWQAVVFGLVVAPAGQLADLAESLLKRDSGLKDSGNIIPGFGGLLDILDSPLGAAPVGYLLLALLR